MPVAHPLTRRAPSWPCPLGLLLAAGLLFPAGSPVFAAESKLTDGQLLKQAESAFQEGMKARGNSLAAPRHFGEAARCFEELHRRGANNPALFADLGQSYLLAGDLPRAILAYRRGLRLAPDDPRLEALLDDARDQVVYTTGGAFGRPPVESWPPWLPRLTGRQRLVLLLFLYSLAWVCLTRWWMVRPSWLFSLGSLALGTAAFLGTGLLSEEAGRRWDREHPVVVIAADSVVLHKGNGRGYPCYDADGRTWLEVAGAVPPGATPLHRGVEARLRFARGAWLQIELAGGEVGWVPRRDVVVDE